MTIEKRAAKPRKKAQSFSIEVDLLTGLFAKANLIDGANASSIVNELIRDYLNGPKAKVRKPQKRKGRT